MCVLTKQEILVTFAYLHLMMEKNDVAEQQLSVGSAARSFPKILWGKKRYDELQRRKNHQAMPGHLNPIASQNVPNAKMAIRNMLQTEGIRVDQLRDLFPSIKDDLRQIIDEEISAEINEVLAMNAGKHQEEFDKLWGSVGSVYENRDEFDRAVAKMAIRNMLQTEGLRVEQLRDLFLSIKDDLLRQIIDEEISAKINQILAMDAGKQQKEFNKLWKRVESVDEIKDKFDRIVGSSKEKPKLEAKFGKICEFLEVETAHYPFVSRDKVGAVRKEFERNAKTKSDPNLKKKAVILLGAIQYAVDDRYLDQAHDNQWFRNDLHKTFVRMLEKFEKTFSVTVPKKRKL